jgi:NTE family protein
MESTTLVLGGGGVWGVAWITGMIAGLADEGIHVRTAKTLIGTSAGSVVATQLCGSTTTEELFLRQTDPQRQRQELSPAPEQLAPLMALMQRQWDDDAARMQAVREIALSAKTVPVEERRAAIATRMGTETLAWPDRDLRITAVDVDSGELHVFDAKSGVGLIDAIAASCAVPGVWPLVPIQGRRYTDGGVWRTTENAHLAHGAKSVLILSPFGGIAATMGRTSPLDKDVEALRTSGSNVTLICADLASLATAAPGPLNPVTRAPAAQAGRVQARSAAAKIRSAKQ